MALFTKDTKKKTSKPATKKVATKRVAEVRTDVAGNLAGVLIRPWFSEKAILATEKGVYVFEVPTEATKTQIAAAIVKVYGVTPAKIRVANLPGKRKALRSKRGFGRRAARHKAYVYLQKGDTITLA